MVVEGGSDLVLGRVSDGEDGEGREGMWTYVTVVTPSRARRWLVDAAYPRQRPLDRNYVHVLAEIMRRGEFKAGTLDFRSLDGRDYLIDGQHRLEAIVESGVTVSMNVLVLAAPDMDAIHRDYARSDRGRARSLQEAFRAHGLAEGLALTRTDVRMLSAVASVLTRGFMPRMWNEYATRAIDARLRVMDEWAPEAHAYVTSLYQGQQTLTRLMRNGGCAAVAMVTFRHVPASAHGFWSAVAANDGLRRGQPAHTLAQYLLERVREQGYREHLMARAAARCWNAYVDSQELTKVQHSDPTAPIVIKGTPYDGKGLGKG